MRCFTRTYKYSIKLNKKKDRDSPVRAGGGAAHFSRRCGWGAMGMDQMRLKDKKNTLFCRPIKTSPNNHPFER
jgi:hypothetical protein